MRSRLPVAFLVVVLALLAGLQYHWIGQITDAERDRLNRTMREAAIELTLLPPHTTGQPMQAVPTMVVVRFYFHSNPPPAALHRKGWRDALRH